MESTIQNTALQTWYRSIITAKHEAFFIPSFNWALWRQRSWAQRPIGAQGASPAINTTTIMSTGHHQANDKNGIRSIQMSSRRHQLLPKATIDNRTPENSRLHPWTRQFTAETYRAQRPNGAQGASLKLKTMITSTRPSLRVNGARSPVEAPTMDGVVIPLSATISKTKGDAEMIYQSAQLRLHFFRLSEVHLSQFACPPTALPTSKKPTYRSILRQTYGYSYLRRRICLRLKHIEEEKLSLDWSELMAAIRCAVWSAFTVDNRHNSANCLRWLQWLQWLWLSRSTSIMDNRSSPTLWMIFDCNYINDKGGNRQIKRQRSFDTQQAKNYWWRRHQWRLWTKIWSPYLCVNETPD